MPHLVRLAGVLVLCPFAIAEADMNPGAPFESIENWTLSAKPTVQIGAVSGEEGHELYRAESALRMPDGRIVVLNAGTRELRFYDAEGTYLGSAGGRGEGPGEFQHPRRIYLEQPDTIRVYDPSARLDSWFDADGRFIRSERTTESIGGPALRDGWIHGRALVDGPPFAAQRGPVVASLDRLPHPESGVRNVIVDPQGRLWVHDGPLAAGRAVRWSIHRPDATPLAQLTTPAGFEIQYIGADFLLGRERDDMDVEFIRMYAMSGPSVGAIEHPIHTAAPYAPERVTPDQLRVPMLSALRNLMSHQERFFSTPPDGETFSYATHTDQLPEWPREFDGFEVFIVRSGPTGWLAVALHEEGYACSTSVGTAAPVGCTPGIATCQ